MRQTDKKRLAGALGASKENLKNLKRFECKCEKN
jgi:hypothetical protein